MVDLDAKRNMTNRVSSLKARLEKHDSFHSRMDVEPGVIGVGPHALVPRLLRLRKVLPCTAICFGL
ncbi:hypothetical protein [Mycobacterium sp.]|uniref:hypothetical protein n=1 Tax=Mycobacterium sp. TaxID=1785 RepID=UPI003F94C392